LHTHRGAIGQSFCDTSLSVTIAFAAPPATPRPRTGPRRYRLNSRTTIAPWTATMTTHFHKLLGAATLGLAALCLLIRSLVSATYVNYDSNLRQLFAICAEENLCPLHGIPATMVRYTACIDVQGTVAASSMQPYYSFVGKLLHGHQ
jgi:hypothetical protein